MRNLKYVSLLLAAGMFAACSDNLDVNKENGAGGGDKTPAYLTISIANNGNSSRANTGTDDGTAEDSELGNAGTANENKVNTILLVALSEDESSGIAKLYAAGTGGNVSDWTNAAGTYTTDETLKLSVGTYKILAVANPYANFVNGINETTEIAKVRELYDKITEGKYVPAGDVTTADAAAAVLATDDNGVMMGNKAEVTVELKEENTPEHPAEATVEIERAVSKITFRNKMDGEDINNVYEVPVSAGTVKAKTVQGKINADDSEVTLNVAYDICSPTPNTVYVLVNDVDKTTTVYGAPEQGSDVYRLLTAKTQEEYNLGTAENKKEWYVVKDTSKPWESLNYQFDEESATAGNWYVRIEGYALTNLSKEQNHVRHIGDGHGVSTPFGTLNGNNYLITPYWADKNGVTFGADGNFTGNPATTTWFYNTLADVSAESENLTIDTDGSFKNGGAAATYYRALPTTDEDPGTVTGGTSSSNPEVGARMAYCFENSTDIDHQTHGLSTGISFVARMYKDESCTQPITTLYQYNGYNFESLKAIGEAFGANTPKKIQDLIDKAAASTPITKEDLEAAGIKQYSSNICYYYTTEIKHFDNGNNNTLGNMEFAIMRNNIYSLAITNISKIGDPIVDPTPETPNETKEAALKVSVKIIPWIVRYNDIEF
ncbi:fimbria major subunit [Phocaeicola barnesiae]